MRARTAALILTAAAVLSGCSGTFQPGPPTGSPGAASLSALAVAGENHAASYRRAAFGQAWRDVDRNGCGQRDDVLRRDLADIRLRGRCVVIAGTLTDPYTGQQVTFTKAHADAVQIDHIVSLAEAWRSGAWSWTTDQREAFANDLTELQATAGPVNQAKGDDDATIWHPVGRTRACAYARAAVMIKTRYRLSVDPAERNALVSDLAGCP